jgi:hypothetical protein
VQHQRQQQRQQQEQHERQRQPLEQRQREGADQRKCASQAHIYHLGAHHDQKNRQMCE